MSKDPGAIWTEVRHATVAKFGAGTVAVDVPTVAPGSEAIGTSLPDTTSPPWQATPLLSVSLAIAIAQ